MADHVGDKPSRKHRPQRRLRWSRRHNRLGVRNGRFAVLLVVAIVAGVAATILTAYLGLR